MWWPWKINETNCFTRKKNLGGFNLTLVKWMMFDYIVHFPCQYSLSWLWESLFLNPPNLKTTMAASRFFLHSNYLIPRTVRLYTPHHGHDCCCHWLFITFCWGTCNFIFRPLFSLFVFCFKDKLAIFRPLFM